MNLFSFENLLKSEPEAEFSTPVYLKYDRRGAVKVLDKGKNSKQYFKIKSYSK
jgi:hypothetical protein